MTEFTYATGETGIVVNRLVTEPRSWNHPTHRKADSPMNEDKSETTGQRTDDPMLDHACTMRIALAIARRQNELDLRLHRIEQALKLGGHANFPSTDRNQGLRVKKCVRNRGFSRIDL